MVWKFIILLFTSHAVNSLNFSGKTKETVISVSVILIDFFFLQLHKAHVRHTVFYVYRAQLKKFVEQNAEKPIHIVITYNVLT